MNKKLLIFVFSLFALAPVFAQKYWVGKNSNWHDAGNWSDTRGGKGGAPVPGHTDDVFIDQSTAADNLTNVISIGSEAVCKSITVINFSEQLVITSDNNSYFTIYGSCYFSENTILANKGKIIFKSNSIADVRFPKQQIDADIIFNSALGSWNIKSDINTRGDISLVSGKVKVASDRITCNNFIGSGSNNRSIEFDNTLIEIKEGWLFKDATNLNFNAGASTLSFLTKKAEENFTPGFLKYNKIISPNGLCSPSGNPCTNYTINLTGTDVVCNGQSNGTATANTVGTTGTVTYLWSPGGQTTQTATGLGPGTYLVQVSDGSGEVCFCSISITEPPLLIGFQQSVVQPLCNGNANGSATVGQVGGTPGYTYSWSTVPAQTTQTATGLIAGTYTAFVTDSKGCSPASSHVTIVVNQPAVLVHNGTSSNIPCKNGANGVASVTPTGGTTPYTYLWQPGNQTTSTITGLIPGTYTCTVTDKNNCTAQYITTITEPAAVLSNTFSSSNNPLACNGDCNATIVSTPAGGTPPYTYNWSPGGQTTATISNLCAGTYTLNLTDANNCPLQQSFTITQPSSITLSTGTSNNPLLCFGSCLASATVTAGGGSPGYTYSWNTTPSQSSVTASNLCAGTYTCYVTDSKGCSNNVSATITQPAQIVITISTTNNPLVCFGNCNATATATVNGGTPAYSYSWAPGGQTTQTTTGLCAGTYTVYVTDGNVCVAQQTVTITQPNQININISTTNNPLNCNAVCNATATANVSGGTAGYNYLWSPGGQTSQTATGLCAGTYTVLITDAAGCTRSNTVTITQPPALVVTLNSTTLLCYNDCNATIGTIVSGGTASYTYSWSPGNQTTPSITGQCAGSYTVLVTDSKGCTRSSSVVISQPTQLSINTASNAASCFGACDGSASAIAGGGTPGYTYYWAPGGQTTNTVTGLCTGNYTVTVTDANSCTKTAVVNITQPQDIQTNITSTNLTCNGNCTGTATVSPAGGTSPYTYSWAPGGQTTAGISNLCVGTYTAYITDSKGCTKSSAVNIVQPTPLNAVIASTTSSCNVCNGTATVNGVGGTAPYAYSWNNGQTTQTATGLCPGNYTVYLTDAGGCTSQAVATVMPTVVIQITSSSSSLSCNGVCNGIATANANGGQAPYSFLWTPTNPFQTTQTATGLCAGTYTVTASDANGCTGIDSVTFLNPPPIVLSTSVSNPTCFGLCNGSATATPSGGTGAFTYSWVPGNITSQTATGLCAGAYTVYVFDANNCSKSATVNLNTASAISPTITSVLANCTFCDGSISIVTSGGIPGYTYNWMPNVSASSSANNLCAGIYTVTITDASGCTSSNIIPLGNSNGPVVSISSTPITCPGGCDGTITSTVSGGNPGYTYSWIPGNQTTASVSNLCSGSHILQVTDNIGCLAYDTLTLTQPPLFNPNAVVTNSSCFSNCNGAIALSVSGGSTPYSYSWNNGATTSSINNLCAGSYSVTITDSKNCDTTITFTITSPAALTVSANVTNATCFNSCTGTASLTVSGGTPVYTYSWSNGSILPNLVNLCAGTYSATITDSKGCTTQQVITITQPIALGTTVTSINASCFGVCNGTATVTGFGGTPGYSYSWTPGNFTTNSISSLCSGIYNCVTTDQNGCTTLDIFNITEPTQVLPNVSSVNAKCNAICNGTAVSNPSGGAGAGFSYSWIPGNLTTSSVSNLCAGSYTVYVTDLNGCTGSQIFSITQPSILQANPSLVSVPTCPGSCNGSLTVSPVGGTSPYNYLWSPVNLTAQTATGLCVGQFTVTVTDANGCTDTQTYNMSNPAPISIVSSVASANCGVCNGALSAIASGGTPGYTYLWTPGNATTSSVSNLCAGLYNLTITDANNCTSQFIVPLGNTNGPVLTMSSTATSCFGSCDGTATVVPAGGPSFTYSWAPGNCTTNICTGLCAGPYYVQVTDTAGCIGVDSVTVNSPPKILANANVVNTTCFGLCNGSISVTPSGGNGAPYSFSWSNNATGASISNLCVGVYSVVISDASGCSQLYSYTIQGNTTVNATVTSSNIICNSACNGSASVTNVSGGIAPYSYLWSDPLGQFNATATGLCAGTFSVTVTDAVGCKDTQSVNISQSMPISLSYTNNNPSCGSCNGQITGIPSGGTAPYSYNWSNGQTTSAVNGLCAGLYSVMVTDSNGCTSTSNIGLSNSSGPQINASVTNINCSSNCIGAISLSPTGGTLPYIYNWLPGGQTTASLSNLCAGTYYVQVGDSNGCITTDSVKVTATNSIAIAQNVVNATCGNCDGSITATPSGGSAPYSYLWLPGNSTTSTISNLCAGSYTVTITDAAGCSQTQIINISNTSSLSAVVTTTNSVCSGSCTGTATPIVTGGTMPYTYSWSNGSAATGISNLCSGNYWLQVTDVLGCKTLVSFSISAPITLGVNIPAINNPSCNGSCNGSITVVPFGGTPAYTYSWSPVTATTSGVSGICAGTYTVLITDNNGCSNQQIITLTDPAVLLQTNSIVNASCNTINDGSITVSVSGGTQPYNFNWSNGSTSQNLINVYAGTYYLIITDSKGCSRSDTFIVASSITIIATALQNDTICDGSCVQLNGTMSTNALQYSWHNITSGNVIALSDTVTVCPNVNSSYMLIVANGACTDSDTVFIQVNPVPSVNAGNDQVVLVGSNVTLGGTPTGPSGATYSWTPATAVNDSTIANPISTITQTTTYTVLVTDINGCTNIDTVTIKIVPQIIFPNGFSPNGDGANDVWIIDNIELFPDCEVEVYNRWGELLFRSVGYPTSERWDGKYKRKDLPVGTYYFIIKLNDPLYPDAFTGPITIMR